MDIDIERLKVDRAYWDDTRGAISGSHYDKESGFFCDDNGYYSEHGFKPRNMSSIRKQPDRFIPRPAAAPPAWNGQGLPPVGAVCEYNLDPSSGKSIWYACFYIGSAEGEDFVLTDNKVDRMKTIDPSRRFRPIRTPEQIQRDDLRALIEDAYMSKPRGHDGGLDAVAEAVLDKYTLEPKA